MMRHHCKVENQQGLLFFDKNCQQFLVAFFIFTFLPVRYRKYQRYRVQVGKRVSVTDTILRH